MNEFIIFVKDNDEKVEKAAKSIINGIDKKKYKVSLTKRHAKALKLPSLAGNEHSFKNASFVVAVGGDGTMLRCARTFASYEIPIIGINLGRRGFLTEIKISQFNKILNDLFKGKYKIDERMMLDVEIIRNNKTIAKLSALNDAVIGKNGIARIIRMSAYVSGKIMTSYAGDGLIIATPTGSTGHNLAANGPILDPSVSAFILTPICPLSITNKPVVISSKEKIEITIDDTPKGIEAILTVDGQSTIKLEKNDKIIIKSYEHRTKFIRMAKYNFFSVLKEKLNWGQ